MSWDRAMVILSLNRLPVPQAKPVKRSNARGFN